tara:strand:- start:1104 stop:2573 length:1470 start_codon:yes stop_codon:yes gene_type:complete
MNNENDEYDEDRLYYEGLSENVITPIEKKNSLPKVVEQYVKDAADMSKYNEIPAAIGFFVILGQLAKDMVVIPSGTRRDDTRIQFIWMQTSGTGKTELYNFFGPVARESFRMINAKHGTEFNVFSVDDATDAALIGSNTKERVAVEDEEGNTTWEEQIVKIDGGLEGSGLIAYDEFEYSGVFKVSQHKENVIMYLNKLMNTLWGENWIIEKKLKEGDMIECRSQRSLYSTTYIPKTLTNVIAEKGVIQRTLIYIQEVPQEIQDELRDMILDEIGTIKPKNAPIQKHANNFGLIYDALRERYEDAGNDPLHTIRFGRGFNDALKNESNKMRNYVSSSRPEVFEIAGNFITRLNQTMTRLAVLCCIAEAPNIKDKEKRFIVTERHVRQASSVIRQCYKSLVTWLDVALKVKATALHEKVNVNAFRTAYTKLLREDDDGWVNKALLLGKVREDTKKGQATIYRQFKEISDMFDNKKIGIRAYVRMKSKEEKE